MSSLCCRPQCHFLLLLVETADLPLCAERVERVDRKLAKERTERREWALFVDLIEAASAGLSAVSGRLIENDESVGAVDPESAECVLRPKKVVKLLEMPESRSEPSVLLLQRLISRPSSPRLGNVAASRRLCIMLPSARSTEASPTVL